MIEPIFVMSPKIAKASKHPLSLQFYKEVSQKKLWECALAFIDVELYGYFGKCIFAKSY
jgi:hypothetical protein